MATVAPLKYDWDTDVIMKLFERRQLETLNDLGGVEALVRRLETDPDNGISTESVEGRVAQFGLNEVTKKEPVTFWEFLAEAFSDKIILLLCGAAVISIIFGMTLADPYTGEVDRTHGWIEGTAIIISILVVTLTGSINNYQKAKKFEELEHEQSIKSVQVIREGKEITVQSPEITNGDIMVLEAGVQIVCDGLLLSAKGDVKCNESNVTGEPLSIAKGPNDPFFISGSMLEEGSAKLLVVAIGPTSFSGKLKADVDGVDEEGGNETPLQEHLGRLADTIGKGGFAGAFFLVAALYIKEGILIGTQGKTANVTNFLNYIIVAITLVVVAIPEGLPLAVTISLAFSMKAMMRDNCMVRVLASCETMGAATAVCSDKTGTLTTNVMTVVQGMMMEEEFLFTGYGLHLRSDSVHQLTRAQPAFSTSKDNLDRMAFAIAINSTAREENIDGKDIWVGNKTEFSLLGFVKTIGRNYQQLRLSVQDEWKKEFPFNSKKKRMTTVVKDNSGLLTAYCKGASEVILSECDRYLDRDGTIVDLNAGKRQLLQDVIADMANQGNRTIGVAFAPCHFTSLPEDEPNLPMVFMGVFGIQDPIREEVPNAVEHCNTAGIIVRMVTGDNLHTAVAIAKKCKIYHENGWDLAMQGQDFAKLAEEDREKLLEIVPRLRVLARSSPHDKFVLVGALQEIGEVVGVTGDGTNDAPALKLSDVGFAMNTGTDVAKSAADMVLLDDNFATVVNAVRWGRAVNDNVRKFLQYQLSINVGGVMLTLVGSLASTTSKEPFTPVQLLWLNLIMDTMAALALATELPDSDALHRSPIFKQAPLISVRMWVFIGVHATFQFILIMLVMFLGQVWFHCVDDPNNCDVSAAYDGTNPTLAAACQKTCTASGGTPDSEGTCRQGRVHSTVIFNMFIWLQLFNIFNARKLFDELNPFEGIWDRSQMLLRVLFFLVAFQVLAVETFQDFMSVTALSGKHWGICIGLGFCSLPMGVIPRLIPLPEFVPDLIKEKARKEAEQRDKLTRSPPLLIHKDPSLRRNSSAMKISSLSHGGGVLQPQ